MKAAICYERNQPVRVEEVTLDAPRRDEVRVRLAASGVCHSDLSFVQGIVRGKLPCILGHEGAGVVEEIGEGVSQVAPGDKVVLSWVTPCFRCFYCRIGKPQLCELGERINQTNRMPDGTSRAHQGTEDLYVFSALGTMAEYAVVPANAAIVLPRGAQHRAGGARQQGRRLWRRRRGAERHSRSAPRRRRADHRHRYPTEEVGT